MWMALVTLTKAVLVEWGREESRRSQIQTTHSRIFLIKGNIKNGAITEDAWNLWRDPGLTWRDTSRKGIVCGHICRWEVGVLGRTVEALF